jgi:hypothetical protein
MFSKKTLLLKPPVVKTDTIHMQGGMDEVTPILQVAPGMVRDALNFECAILGGYARIEGYERYDGHDSPSSAISSRVYIDSFVNNPVAGDTITGGTSGATGYVLALGVNYVVVTEVTGSFAIGEVITDGALTVGNSILPTAGITSILKATHKALAADRKRTYISAVPGSGPVRGVFLYNDLVYAFRDNAGGTETLLYVESATGWTNVPYSNEVYFTAGTTAPAEGATLTQGGVTATIQRVVLQSGAWAGSAAGKIIIDTPSGGNFAAGSATSDTTTLTLSAAESAITFTIGGIFELVSGNFSGQQDTTRVYGCDGVNRCWEFDGTVMVPIDTGFTPDTPSHIQIHKNFLFVTVLASLGYSAPGLPYDWTAISGAGVEAVGDNITNIIELPGAQTTAAMGVWTRKNTKILYGTGASSWNLVDLNTGCGGLPYTVQNMAHTYTMDDRGVIDMQQTQNYGNFDINTITYRMNNFIASKRSRVVGSCLNRHKSQYRIFCSDGYGLYVTNLYGENAWQNIGSGCMPVLFPNPVYCVTDSKLSNGNEVAFFGSTNGYVYQLDVGSSFDGATIPYLLTFGANSVSSPLIIKDYKSALLGVSGSSYFQFDFGYILGYGASTVLQPNFKTYDNPVSTPVWDSFTWDDFVWDGTSSLPIKCDMKGVSEVYAIKIKGSSALFYTFNIESAIVSFIPRRLKR